MSKTMIMSKVTKAFVQHYPINLVRLGQMLILVVFINLTPILGLYMFGIPNNLI